MNRQLALGITLGDAIGFDNFIVGKNRQLLDALQSSANGSGEQQLYLWGGEGCGKSHLLQSAVQMASLDGRQALYLSMEEHHQFSTEILEGLEALELICIDDIDSISGNSSWEEALFHLYNRLRDAGHNLITASGCAPLNLQISLNDLRSRLGWGASYQVKPLDEAEKFKLLTEEAQRRGMQLTPETARFILSRTSRDVRSLKRLVKELDKASLAAKRRLTIPFIREWMSQDKSD